MQVSQHRGERQDMTQNPTEAAQERTNKLPSQYLENADKNLGSIADRMKVTAIATKEFRTSHNLGTNEPIAQNLQRELGKCIQDAIKQAASGHQSPVHLASATQNVNDPNSSMNDNTSSSYNRQRANNYANN